MHRTAGVAAVLLGTLTLAAPANAVQEEQGGGCAAFGANVASLATGLGPLFGAAASGVATSTPTAFPTMVVHPEQDRLCTG